MKTARTSRMVRASLLASAAGLCLSLAAGSAQAATDDPVSDGTLIRPLLTDSVRESQGGRVSGADVVREAQTDRVSITDTLREAQLNAPRLTAVEPDPQIVIANPPPGPGQTVNTTVTDRDPVNITGVGQMIVDTQDGFIGLCTGTLINPRTVIFAAHCVNEEAATLYGNKSGGRPIAFGFSNSNNTAGNSAFGHYLNTGNTNTADFLYNVNQVRYNPISTTADCAGFLCGDIALASFDTPTKNIPTWALLFSALPARDLGAAGTGYHVVIEGYGNNGTGTAGSVGGIDYRRRLAENMLGGLASLDEFENFLFGGASAANPQNLYWIDFDDPRRGTAGADSRDFNAWRDNATPGTATKTSQEGMTAAGDSGGPLVLDNTYAKVVVIGVLSGGYTRFFNGAPANGYGTAGFYQPLYLYWDWIAQNNPYHYVGAVAGNGNWTDPTHWVTNIDPSYQVLTLVNGNLVLTNGVPTVAGAGNTDQPGFGEACFQSANVSDCLNIATGTETVDGPVPPHPIGTSGDAPGDVGNDRGNVASGTLSGGGAASESLGDGSSSSSDGSQSSSGSQNPNALPLPTLTNGLPGATNFVPNNVDPVRVTGAIGKYFDVTLTAAGTTTLDTAVTIDRFSIGIGGGNAVLDVKSTGSLTSLIDITQATGTIHANGALITPGDYMMISGGLDGTGTVTAAFFTSVAGTLAPATAGTIGTLNFRGNIILASGSTYNLDLGASGSSDKIAVAPNGAGTGIANVGGRLVLGTSASTLRGNNTYTILTAASVTGKFIDPAAFSAILTPKLTYTSTAVTLQVVVGQYGNVIDKNNPIQTAYGMLLDRNRGQAASRDALYGPLDLQDQATIRATLSALAPTTETLGQSLGIAGVDNWSSLIRNRIDGMGSDEMGGTLARYGAPTQVAANGINALSMGGMGAMGFGSDIRSDAQQPMVEEGVLPETMTGFIAGGYLTGDSTPMTGILNRDDYTGWYAAGGVETTDDNASLGAAFSYTRLDGTGALPGQSAHANLFQGTLYGKANLGGATLDTMFTAGLLDLRSARAVSFVGTPYTVRSDTGNLVVVSEIGLSKDFDIGAIRITPRVAGRASHIGFSRTAEEGGPMALMITRTPVNSTQARGGLTIAGTGPVKPFLNGTFVHDFMDRPAVLGANFVGGVGGNVLFALNGQDHDWAEVSGGLTYEAGNVSFSASAETTIERQDVSSQAYRGSISFKF